MNPNILREITARDYPQMAQSIEDFIRNEVSEKNSTSAMVWRVVMGRVWSERRDRFCSDRNLGIQGARR